MKSLYKRELTMMVGIVALSFTLLSTAFMLLSYRYIISETRDRLERNAGYIAAATSDYLQNVDSLSLLDGIKWTLYQSTMETVSAVSEASVIVTNTQGEILYATDSDLYHKQIPDRVVQQILQHQIGLDDLRVGRDLGGQALGDLHALVDDHNAVGQIHRLLLVVGHVEGRDI